MKCMTIEIEGQSDDQSSEETPETAFAKLV
jgi:hypothetical protein